MYYTSEKLNWFKLLNYIRVEQNSNKILTLIKITLIYKGIICSQFLFLSKQLSFSDIADFLTISKFK